MMASIEEADMAFTSNSVQEENAFASLVLELPHIERHRV